MMQANKMKSNNMTRMYKELFMLYGSQGWWPLIEVHRAGGTNPTKSGSIEGYHLKDYSYPRNERQKFEICIGAILTQNTSWPNVEKALVNLDREGLIDAQKISRCTTGVLAQAIRPAGYFNQKSMKLREFTRFYLSLEGKTPSREDLLAVWGIGPETADSILLYAYKKPVFVVDTYTRRMLIAKRMIDDSYSYGDIQSIFEKSLPRDYKLFQEFHALIVENGKHH